MRAAVYFKLQAGEAEFTKALQDGGIAVENLS